MINSIIVSPHLLMRGSLNSLLEESRQTKVIGAVNEVNDLKKLGAKMKPDLVFISLDQDEIDYSSLMTEISIQYPLSKIVFIGHWVDQKNYELIKRGPVAAFISRYTSPNTLFTFLSNYNPCLNSQEVFIDEFTCKKLQEEREEKKINELTLSKREVEVLNLICQEKTTPEISQLLGLSIRTIETFRRRMILKAGCKNMIGVILKVMPQQSHPVLKYS